VGNQDVCVYGYPVVLAFPVGERPTPGDTPDSEAVDLDAGIDEHFRMTDEAGLVGDRCIMVACHYDPVAYRKLLQPKIEILDVPPISEHGEFASMDQYLAFRNIQFTV
jgi:hypothetical protein